MAKPQPIESVAYGVKWHKLERPKPWKPTEPGTE